MFVTDFFYLLFLLVILFIIIYKGFRKVPSDTPASQNVSRSETADRQGNIFTISDDTTGNTNTNRFGDFFYLEPTSEDAARIRSQLEKDDKELPSYDEVMGMSNLATPTAAAAGMSSNTSIATADTMLDVPPYSEIDTLSPPNTTTAREGNSVDTFSGAVTGAPSTSRAAAAAVTVTLPITASNTMV